MHPTILGSTPRPQVAVPPKIQHCRMRSRPHGILSDKPQCQSIAGLALPLLLTYFWSLSGCCCPHKLLSPFWAMPLGAITR